MLIKQFTEMRNPKIWDLSENDDIIITRKGQNEQRVLINFKTYEAMKKTLANRKHLSQQSQSADSFDLSPYLQDFIDILQNDEFEDITDDDHYFENFVRELKTGE